MPETQSQGKKRPRHKKRPGIIIPQTPATESSSTESNLEGEDEETAVHVKETKKVRFKMSCSESNSESDTNPPLIRLSQANIMVTDDSECDQPTFIRSSNTDSERTGTSSELSSVEIPNAQLSKYSIEQTSSDNVDADIDDDDEETPLPSTEESSKPKVMLSPINVPKKQTRIDEYLSPAPTPPAPPADLGAPNPAADGECSATLTSTPKEPQKSIDGAYSLVMNEPRLSTL